MGNSLSWLSWAADAFIPHRPSETPGEESGATWRKKAGEEARLRSSAFDESQRAYTLGRRAEAKELSDKGKEHKRKMEQYNAKAADEIFAHYNPLLLTSSPTPDALAQVDFHGLFVTESLARARAHVAACRRQSVKRTVFITGRGNRSAGGLAKIKPAMEDFLKSENLVAYMDVPNAGCITVDIDVKDKAPGWGDSCVVM
ncbi:DUF1771-domain-containing protein [Punctularia strigosozonata HHB-11173 SS5]|uniref:DUF1771-domain-containing protein n=1 Tax=Punctularia strigosozonata (strain HHB-11173) TaxID=741275 RepID=UPI0004416A74|nr:DUF1771-domain-containing protein [Punctularia strigosozonata HHB-11173 SS5]EIN09822.1 DUF1771-domain-containing protein [Punctularia strigosozonata HHB-11173 SS5]